MQSRYSTSIHLTFQLITKKIYCLFLFLIWPSITVFACSLIKQPVDRFKADTFVYTAVIVDIYTHDNLFNNSELDAESPEYNAGAIALNPIQVWNAPENLSHHGLFIGNLMPDCSYAFSSYDAISSDYSVGDTVAVVSRYMNAGLWQETMPDYLVLMDLPFANTSVANTKYLSPDLLIENKVLSFTSVLDSLIAEMQDNEKKIQARNREYQERLNNQNRRDRASFEESEREHNLKARKEYEQRRTILSRYYTATIMRKNFEFQRNLSLVHNSRSQDERKQHIVNLSHDWYSRWGNHSYESRTMYDCGFTSLITHYLSNQIFIDELFEIFEKNNGRQLLSIYECLRHYDIPYTK